MKINKDIYLEATAQAMSRKATKKLFKSEPRTFDLFSMFALAVFTRVDGKDITDDEYADAVATVITDTLPEDITSGVMLKDIALMIFSQHIWEELEKLDKPDQKDSETEKFKSELKSAITK